MRKTPICILSILLILTFSGGFTVLFVKSELVSNIVSLKADGSLEPLTAPIQHSGDVYILTRNISGGLAVHKSNIVIDDAGFALNGNGGIGIDLQNNVTRVPSASEIWNVTIKNLAVINFDFSVKTNAGGNNTLYYDYIANSISGLRGGIFLWGCGGNNITHCNISGNPAVFIDFGSSGNNVFENNLSGGVWLEMGGDETVDRNYWTDYLSKCPTATEIDSSGTGNTPYAFDTYGMVSGALEDNHPQINPITNPTFQGVPIILPTQQLSSLGSEATPNPTPITTPRSSPDATTPVPEFPSMIALAILFAATIAVSVSYKKVKKWSFPCWH